MLTCQVDYILNKYDGNYHALFTRLRYKYASEQAETGHANGGGGDKGGGAGGGAVSAGGGGGAVRDDGRPGWLHGLGERVKGASDAVKEAVEKGKDNLHKSGKLEELGGHLGKLKENTGRLKEGAQVGWWRPRPLGALRARRAEHTRVLTLANTCSLLLSLTHVLSVALAHTRALC